MQTLASPTVVIALRWPRYDLVTNSRLGQPLVHALNEFVLGFDSPTRLSYRFSPLHCPRSSSGNHLHNSSILFWGPSRLYLASSCLAVPLTFSTCAKTFAKACAGTSQYRHSDRNACLLLILSPTRSIVLGHIRHCCLTRNLCRLLPFCCPSESLHCWCPLHCCSLN